MTPEPSLTISTRHIPAGPVLALAGDLDHATAGSLRTALDTLALAPGQALTLDLTALGFCDSSGITVLLAAHSRAHAQAAEFILSNVPPATARILNLLGLTEILLPWRR